MNKRHRNTLIGPLMFFLLILTVSCTKEKKEHEESGLPLIGFTHINMTHSFYKSWIHEQSKADFVYSTRSLHRDSKGDISKQIRDIRNFIEQGVDVIVINPIDVIAIEEVVSEAIEAGILCLSSANIIDVPGVSNAILPEYDVMAEIAHLSAAYLNYKGNVLYLAGKKGNWASDHRREGFLNTIADYPDIKVLDWKDTDFDFRNADRIAGEWLEAYPEIDMIIANDDALALPVLEAVTRADRDDEIKIFSYTGEPAGVKAVQEGKLLGNSLVSAERFAWWHVQLIQRLLKGERMEFAYMDVPIIITDETYEIVKTNGMHHAEELEWITPEGALEAIKRSSLEFSEM